MATYKLIQDIEAEDHILGPLSLRQFIFALGAAFSYYICFIITFKIKAPFLLVLFLPPALFFTFFAFPFGKDQSTEVWALAKLRFWFKPRKRVWDQSGVKELVTITAPKKIERVLTNGLDQEQVRSRLNALANTIDTRGWAIKNVTVNAYAQQNPMTAINSDRLVDPSSFPQEVSNSDIVASDDILDTVSNPIAHQFDQMITQSAVAHRQELIDQLNSPVASATPGQPAAPPTDYWFLNQTSGATALAPTYQPQLATAQAQDATPAEEAIAAQVRVKNAQQHVSTNHLRTLQPLGAQPQQQALQQPVQQAVPAPSPIADPAVTAHPDAAILSLANNNDLNVSTIAREASKARGEDPSDHEVVISLR